MKEKLVMGDRRMETERERENLFSCFGFIDCFLWNRKKLIIKEKQNKGIKLKKNAEMNERKLKKRKKKKDGTKYGMEQKWKD
jgi:hypothetical protein